MRPYVLKHMSSSTLLPQSSLCQWSHVSVTPRLIADAHVHDTLSVAISSQKINKLKKTWKTLPFLLEKSSKNGKFPD